MSILTTDYLAIVCWVSSAIMSNEKNKPKKNRFQDPSTLSYEGFHLYSKDTISVRPFSATSPLSTTDSNANNEQYEEGEELKTIFEAAAPPVPQISTRPKPKKSPYLGVLYTVYAIFMTSLGGVIATKLTHIHPLTVIVYSFPVGILTSSFFTLYRSRVAKRPLMTHLSPISEHKREVVFMWVRLDQISTHFPNILN